MRLIDADVIFPYVKKLEDLAQKRIWDTPTNSPCYQRYRTQYTEREEFRKIVENSPTVDAVPVIRCRDCDNRVYMDMGDAIGVVGGCAIWEAALSGDFYCAYGKRGD